MTAQKRDCEDCDEHKVLIERIKILEKLPSVFSWMNMTKGVGFLLIVTLTIFFGILMTTRSELFEKNKDQEVKLEKQVEVIKSTVNKIETNVAVMVRTYEMSQQTTQKELEEIRRKIQ